MCRERILFFEDKIQWLQSLQPTEDIISQERRAQAKLSEWLNRQEIIWRQKSRELWLTAGDRNSIFFHASTINNRRKIYIASLKNNEGVWMETKNQIGDFLVKEFTDLFRAKTINQVQPVDLFFQPTSIEVQNNILKCIPNRDEILKTVKSLYPIKAPGPDEMSALFFQHYWDIVGNDVVTTIQNIFRRGVFPQVLDDSFIVFILKSIHFTSFNQTRPISLCNTLYKIFSKILVSLLRPLLHGLISPNRSEFVPGWWIGENSLLVQEIIHSMKLKK